MLFQAEGVIWLLHLPALVQAIGHEGDYKLVFIASGFPDLSLEGWFILSAHLFHSVFRR